MDFQNLVDMYEMATAVLSVEKTADGHWGDIRIVRANSQYKQIMGPNYHDDMIYSELIPKEQNFEDFCFRCAVQKQHLHSYVDTKSMGVWTDATYIPLSKEYDTDKLSYFIFYFEFTKAPDLEKLSNISLETAPFVIQTCLNLRGAANFYEAMNTVISDIQVKTESFCSSIIMIDKERQKYATLCAAFSDPKITMADFAPYLTSEVVFTWEETLKQTDCIIVKDDFDMEELSKRNPIWVESLRSAGVKSLILAPLMQGTKMTGVLFITNFNVKQIVELKEFIELTAFFLAAEINNNNLMERLEYMSNIDTLTGVKNRNSMNARVDWHVNNSLSVKTPFGIIFADLNGLKQCNDNGGHEAGDKLLIKAANLLTKHFGDYEIYRSGGDEFVVIVQECHKEDFEQKAEKLRAESGYGSEVCLAIGTSWTTDGKELRYCMHLADEAMYADKKEYYRQHPDIARK